MGGMDLDGQRACVICHQLLPQRSKLTVASIPREEAERNHWTGRLNSDGTLAVHMCLQCQIDLSKNRGDGSTEKP